MRVTARLVGWAVAALAACAPPAGPAESQVTSAQVLAVRGEPPEVAAGQSAHFDLLVASPQGTVLAPSVQWGTCVTPPALGDNDVVSADCVSGAGTAPAGSGSSLDVTIPADACALFGPDPPPGGLRPPDPDATGGYYQPVVAQVSGAASAVGLERLTCDLANAPASVAHAYATQYVLNRNPSLLPLIATVAGAPARLDAIPAGAHVALQASWPAMSAETYVVFDPSSESLVAQRESMQVSWHATAGAFDSDRTGRSAGDLATTTDDGWTAPGSPGVVHLWVVLRDSRGGVDFASYDVTVAR